MRASLSLRWIKQTGYNLCKGRSDPVSCLPMLRAWRSRPPWRPTPTATRQHIRSTRHMSDATGLLEAVAKGERQAAADLFPLVYGELRKLAASRMAGEAHGHTLDATALVHET